MQPAHRCVAHLMSIIIREIKMLDEDAEMEYLCITQPEAARWNKGNTISSRKV